MALWGFGVAIAGITLILFVLRYRGVGGGGAWRRQAPKKGFSVFGPHGPMLP